MCCEINVKLKKSENVTKNCVYTKVFIYIFLIFILNATIADKFLEKYVLVFIIIMLNYILFASVNFDSPITPSPHHFKWHNEQKLNIYISGVSFQYSSRKIVTDLLYISTLGMSLIQIQGTELLYNSFY